MFSCPLTFAQNPTKTLTTLLFDCSLARLALNVHRSSDCDLSVDLRVESRDRRAEAPWRPTKLALGHSRRWLTISGVFESTIYSHLRVPESGPQPLILIQFYSVAFRESLHHKRVPLVASCLIRWADHFAILLWLASKFKNNSLPYATSAENRHVKEVPSKMANPADQPRPSTRHYSSAEGSFVLVSFVSGRYKH
jgi:hypothetical protein